MFIVVLALLSFSSALSAQIYKWVDENGTVHYQDQKPKEKDAEIIQIKTSVSKASQSPNKDLFDKVDELNKQKEIELEEKAKALAAEQRADALKKRCEDTRKALQAYRNKHRVLDVSGDEPVRLSHEQKIAKMAEFEQILREECQ